MAVLPAVIGLLPMPGGALFSAPLVEDCDEHNEVPPLIKSQINYWFRHVWELTWPLYPGVILATDIAGLEVWQVFLVGIPMMATSITAGYFFILKKARIGAGHTTPSNHRFVVMMLPIITVIVVYLLITLFLPGVGQINKYLPMLIGIAAAILVLQYRRPMGWSEWKGVLFSRRALNMAVIVALIRIYGAFIEARLPGGAMLMEQMRIELNTLGIPLILLIMVLPFISGLTTGISVGFVGASLPIAFSLLSPEAGLAERLGTLMLTYPFGFIGVMLSPVHVCFIVTSEHFKTSLVKSMGRILIPSAIVLAASFAVGMRLDKKLHSIKRVFSMATERKSEMIQDLEEKREEILREIEEYNREREQIKSMLGKIGGEKYSKTDKIINIFFVLLIIGLITLEITTHFLPPYISLEIGVLLVSIKIIWMIHSQHKFNHFQFWILNSLEFRMNNMYSRIKKIERLVTENNSEQSGS